MPNSLDLTINEGGYVYARFNRRVRGTNRITQATQRLGHISELLHVENRIGQFVKRWWSGYMSSLDQEYRKETAPAHRIAKKLKWQTFVVLGGEDGHPPVDDLSESAEVWF